MPREGVQNFVGKQFVDFLMAWHGLFEACGGVFVNVVVMPVTQQIAPAVLEFSDKVPVLHETSNSPSRRTPKLLSFMNSFHRS